MHTRLRSRSKLDLQTAENPAPAPTVKRSTVYLKKSKHKIDVVPEVELESGPQEENEIPVKRSKINLKKSKRKLDIVPEALELEEENQTAVKQNTSNLAKQEINEEEKNYGSKRCFVNLTNMKSLSLKDCEIQDSGNKPSQPAQEMMSIKQLTSQPHPLSQSGEIIFSQVTTQNVSDDSKEEIIIMMRGIKKALEKNFKNVSDRLQLHAVPPFLYTLKEYRENYSKNARFDLSKPESEYMARNFLSDGRYFLFINYVRNTILGVKEFPGVFIMRGILELIMRIKAEEVKVLGISTQQTISELYSLFNSILMTFPHSSLRSSYLQLLELPFNLTTSVKRIKGKEQQGVLHSMLSLLSDLIHRDDLLDCTNQSNSQENFNNFFLWDKQNEEKSSFHNFPREEKFERIFIVLELVTTLLENDMATFIVQYSKLRSFITNNEQCPLIYSILWRQKEGAIGINELIKSIVNIFVSSIALNYPRKSVLVMARLMNLLSHVMNLYEYSNGTDYPCYKSTSTSLVQEILKAIESSPCYNFELIISVAENLRSPLTKMLLVNQVVQKIHNIAKPISLAVPFDLIRNKEFVKFKNVMIPKFANKEKYPVNDANKEAVRFEVNQRSYLKLLRIYAESVNSYYCIQAGLIENKRLDQEEQKSCTNLQTSSNSFTFDDFEEKVKAVNLDEEIQLREVDLTFKKQINIKLSKESCELYLKEIKHFYLLPKLIKKCHEKFGAKFDDWVNLVQDMEVKLSD